MKRTYPTEAAVTGTPRGFARLVMILLVLLALFVSGKWIVGAKGRQETPPPGNVPSEPVVEVPPPKLDSIQTLGNTVNGRGEVSRFEYAPAKTVIPILRDEEDRHYVPPQPVLGREALAKAFAERQVHLAESNPPLYRMAFDVPIHTSDIRRAAAVHLNERNGFTGGHPKAFNEESIALLPCTAIEVVAFVDDRQFLLYQSYGKALGRSGSMPTELPMAMIGTEEELSAWMARGRCGLTASYAAFSLKKSVLKGSLSVLASQRFAQDLAGDGIWEDLRKYEQSGKNHTISVGPFSMGDKSGGNSVKVSRQSAVTRNQLMAVTRRCVSEINMEDWQQDGHLVDENFRRYLIEQMTSTLLNRFSQQTAVVGSDGKLIESDWLQRDLKPDHISSLNASIKQLWNQKKHTAAKVKIGPIDIDGSDSGSLLSNDDIEWTGSGEAVAPKSVRLYQVNQAALDELASFRYASIEATSREGGLSSEFIFTERLPDRFREGETRAVSFEIPTMALISGGDADVHSGNRSPTELRMWHSAPVATPGGVQVTVYSEVVELPSNHTRLRGSVSKVIPMPEGFSSINREQIRMIDSRRRLQTRIIGEQHDYVHVPTPTTSIVRNLEIRPDGRGDDHRGNARARGQFVIPVMIREANAGEQFLQSVNLEVFSK